MTIRTVRPFFFGGLTATTLEDLKLELQTVFGEIEETTADIRSVIEYGPIPGGYFPIHLVRSSAPGTALPTGPVAQMAFSFELRPIHVSLICYDGNVTVNLRSGGAEVLAAGAISLVSATPQTFDNRGDFNLDKITSDATLSVASIDSGTPIYVAGVIVGKNASKVEPA